MLSLWSPTVAGMGHLYDLGRYAERIVELKRSSMPSSLGYFFTCVGWLFGWATMVLKERSWACSYGVPQTPAEQKLWSD